MIENIHGLTIFFKKSGCLCHPNLNEWHLCTIWRTALYYYMITLPLCDIVMMWEQHCAGVTRYGTPAPCHECHECHGAEKQFAGHSQLRQNTDNSPFPLGCLAQDPATAERDFRSTHILVRNYDMFDSCMVRWGSKRVRVYIYASGNLRHYLILIWMCNLDLELFLLFY